MKKIAWYTSIILATLAVVFLLWQFRLAVILFVSSLVVASVLRPIVDSIAAHKVARGWALALTYFLVVIFILALVLFIGGPILSEARGIMRDLPKTYEQIHTAWLKGSWLQHTIALNFPDFNHLFNSFSTTVSGAFIQSLLSVTRRTLELAGDIRSGIRSLACGIPY